MCLKDESSRSCIDTQPRKLEEIVREAELRLLKKMCERSKKQLARRLPIRFTI